MGKMHFRRGEKAKVLVLQMIISLGFSAALSD